MNFVEVRRWRGCIVLRPGGEVCIVLKSDRYRLNVKRSGEEEMLCVEVRRVRGCY
jgi:hypothetical protein